MFLNEDLREAVSKAWKARRDKNHWRIEVSGLTGQARRILRTIRRLSEDEIATLIQEYEAEATQKELAVKWGIGRTTIIALFEQRVVRTRRTVRKLDGE